MNSSLCTAQTLALAEATQRSEPKFVFPTVRAEHQYARALLENAMRYVLPENQMIDPLSDYPVEGYNQDPSRGLYLRNFTQLTAIGLWLELLGDVSAGYADTPYLSRQQALDQLAKAVASLRQDQQDPLVSAKGLLSNFLDLGGPRRNGPLAASVDKRGFRNAFGREKGEAIWQALRAKGWVLSQNGDREGHIDRSRDYGWTGFTGPLAPYADEPTRQKILTLLDQRLVLIVFGDNANLSTSVAKTIGALLAPSVRDNPRAVKLRGELEQFLDAQQEGYTSLYDPGTGLFHFGWDATQDRLIGWQDEGGNWQTGKMDYLINEFRGPTKFIVVRYGLPIDAVKNLGFKMKSYQMRDGRTVHVPAPWEGSAFQALGLGISMLDLGNTCWLTTLRTLVEVEIDYASRHRLPGFLSESYTGSGTEYTGRVGIPDIAVDSNARITNTPSLYTLGVAYRIAPEQIERFLADNWPAISRLLTDHGPWEGVNVATGKVIEFQTSAHTLSLILGMLGTSPENMDRYLQSRGLIARAQALYAPGRPVDLLAGSQVFAWADKGSTLHTSRASIAFQAQSDNVQRLGIAFVSPRPEGVNLSGGRLTLSYRSPAPLERVTLALKSAEKPSTAAQIIPTEIFTRLPQTGPQGQRIDILLPATPGLNGIKEVVLTSEPKDGRMPVDLTITGLSFSPCGVGE